MATATLTTEESQLGQTIEMFEVITQSQPQDYQSLEILREAYAKLGRDPDVLRTSKRIAQAYVLMGQLSSAILEYESILQRSPKDKEVRDALEAIQTKADDLTHEPALEELDTGGGRATDAAGKPKEPARKTACVDDGAKAFEKLFVDSKVISKTEFETSWPGYDVAPGVTSTPFIQVLADKGIIGIEKALKAISDKTRLGYLPIEKYDIDIELVRLFPADLCRRWCILPLDRMSKSVLVATANPFNQQAAIETQEITPLRLIWYLAPPADISKLLKKILR